jgi:PsbP
MQLFSTRRSASTVVLLTCGLLLHGALAYSIPQKSAPPDARNLDLATTPCRRQWLLGTSAAAFGFVTSSLPATAANLETFNDSAHGFSLQIPSKWQASEKEMVDRRKLLVWTDPDDAAIAVFIAYTPVRDDYTSLGSFGSVNQVADQTILPKGKIMDPNSDVSATMLSAVSQKQAYIFDYKQKVGILQPETHFRTIFTLKRAAPGAAGSILVTITAQAPEARYSAVKTTLDTIIDSYTLST